MILQGGSVDTGVGESLVGISAKWQPARFFGVEFGEIMEVVLRLYK
jgi:hypothetical protein